MDIALNWKDYFPKVDTLMENLIYNLNKEADRVQIYDDYARKSDCEKYDFTVVF